MLPGRATYPSGAIRSPARATNREQLISPNSPDQLFADTQIAWFVKRDSPTQRVQKLTEAVRRLSPLGLYELSQASGLLMWMTGPHKPDAATGSRCRRYVGDRPCIAANPSRSRRSAVADCSGRAAPRWLARYTGPVRPMIGAGSFWRPRGCHFRLSKIRGF